MSRVLVVVAHSDDETLGAGGAIILHARAGDEVWVMTHTDGVGSRQLSSVLALQRKAFLEAACETLGANPIENTHIWPDNKLDAVPLLTLSKEIERVLSWQPWEIVYTHSNSDCNQDHRAVAQAVLIATRPQPGNPVKAVYGMEIPSSTEWSFGKVNGAFTPNLYVDITATLETKLQALSCYADELRPFPHPRSIEAVKALAQWRGATVGVAAAEAFEVLREVR